MPPLSGLQVVELGRVLAAPYAAQILAGLGADVVKVERPGTGDESRAFGPPFDAEGRSYYFRAFNRGKRSIVLDLKRPEGMEALRRLLREADVYLRNWEAPLSDEEARSLNPRLVVCAIDGLGDGAPALDMVAQAASGIMALTGPAGGGPVRCGIPVSDLAAGLHAAIGILAALEERRRTGKGSSVPVSLLASSRSLLGYQAERFFMTGETPSRLGNAHPSIVPYDVYPAADGALVIASAGDAHFRSLCGALGLPDDPRFRTNPGRVRHRAEVDGMIRAAASRLPTAELERRCCEAGVPCGPVTSVPEALAGAAEPPGRAPLLGEHTAAVLAGLGIRP